jgi:alkylation response protein AidB-like acyl-CoA dehydrogenase
MTMEQLTENVQWIEQIHSFGKEFERRAAEHDRDDTFVLENYRTLKEHGFFAAGIPEELGGGGVSHSEMCGIVRTMAQYCGSTALAFSMHQHLVAAVVYRYGKGQGGEEMLRKVASEQPILVSTGAQDWLESSGFVERTEGGFLVSAVKHFASQSAAGDILITSAPFHDPHEGWQVLHFPVPFSAPGMQVLDNWKAMGMRGTGSQSIKLEKVFVPERTVTLRRPFGVYHPVWNVILTVAMPLIMAVYVGIAQRASQIAVAHVKRQKNYKSYHPALVGAMANDLTAAEVHWNDMMRIANNYNFHPTDGNGHDILMRKTNVAHACIGVVSKAMEIAGGQGYYRSFGLEKLFRDVQAAKYHPLQEKEQLKFSGEFILRN